MRNFALLLGAAVSQGSGRAVHVGGHGKEPVSYFCSCLLVLALLSLPVVLTLVLTLSLHNKGFFPYHHPLLTQGQIPCCLLQPEILGANEQLVITSFHCNNHPSPAHFQGDYFHGRWGCRETGLIFLLAV